ncbi:MAG: hypothetical protein WA970_06960, partial [Gammaproteobacteria bacterium]
MAANPHGHSAVVQRLARTIDRSVQRAERRRRRLPVPTFPESLPIIESRRAIASAFDKSQVIVVCGETASGKS